MDTFSRYLMISELSLLADSNPGGVNFYIFVPNLGLPNTNARVESSSFTAENKAAQRDGDR